MPLPGYLPPLLIGQTAFAAVAALHLLGLLQPLDLWAYDTGLARRADTAAVEERVVLVRAREPDLAVTGWPLTDRQFADLLEGIAAAGPAAVAVDIYRDWPVGTGAEALDAVLRAHPEILWIQRLRDESGHTIPPPPALRGTDRVGFADHVTDPDGVVRRGLLYLTDPEGNVAVGLGLAAALRLLARHGIAPRPNPDRPEVLTLGAARIPPLEPTDGAYAGVDAGGYQFMLDFAQGPEPFRSHSIPDALAGRIPREALAGRIVFVAITAESVRDDFRTPLGGFTFGSVLHAQTAAQLLRMAFGTTPPTAIIPDAAELAAIFLAGLAGSLAGLVRRGALAFALQAACGTAVIAGLWYAALAHQLWVPVAGPAAAWLGALGLVIAYLSWRERADREALMQLFAIHVAAPVAEELWRNRRSFMDGGRPRPQRLTATVLFSDIAGFTTVSERLSPEALNAWLHAYMDAMVPIVHAHGGVIMSFLGDGIFAVFGVPIARTTEAEIDRDAVQAVRAALAMEQALAPLNRRWQEEGLPPVEIRIGIHTGPLVAGSIGGLGHMEYTLTGDVVNTASRFESLAKTVDGDGRPVRILVGAATWDRLGDRFLGRAIGEVALKGKDQRVGVHQILGENPSPGKHRDTESPGRVTPFTAGARSRPNTPDTGETGRPTRKGSIT